MTTWGVLIVTIMNVIVLAVGVVIGYLLGTKKIEQIRERIEQAKPPILSGGVKHMTGKEKNFEQLHGDEKRRFEHIIS